MASKLSFVAVAVVGACALLVTAVGARAERSTYLWQCIAISRDDARYRCYSRLLLERIEKSRNPARELPKIDRDVRAQGGELVGLCHGLMHEVGRRYARARALTLSTLRRYVPHSSDPGCSAGFGMGLVMYLGPQLVRTGGREAVRDCMRLPTRFRSYTCIHGLGHALIRGFHGQLEPAAAACRRLGRHGVDCAQGVFHDYWISLRGADDTTRPRNAVTAPRLICDGRYGYVRPCWYRYFIEQRFGPRLVRAADIARACRNLRPLQRFGCVAGASLGMLNEPFVQTKVCAALRGRDAVACLRGVTVQTLAGQPARQARLLRMCRLLGTAAASCYAWFGRTLALVRDTLRTAEVCRGLHGAPARACRDGARRIAHPFATFG